MTMIAMASGIAVATVAAPASATTPSCGTPQSGGTIQCSTLNYPNPNMACEHTPYSTTGSCTDYDWGPTADDTVSPWVESDSYSSRGYSYRNCTDYVAWQLAQYGVPSTDFDFYNYTTYGGDADEWLNAANSSQWSQLNSLTGTTPAINSVAVSVSNDHVMFVTGWNPTTGIITVKEYNYDYEGDGDIQTATPTQLGITGYIYYQSLMTNPPSSGSGGSQSPTNPIAYSSPVAPNSIGGGTIDGFTVAANSTSGTLDTANQSTPGGSWSSVASQGGGTIVGDPVLAPLSASGYNDAGMLAAAINNDGNLEVAAESSVGGSYSWANLGGSLTGEPVVVPNILNSSAGISGGFSIFAVGTDGNLYTTWQSSPGGGWSSVVSLGGGTIVGNLTVVPFSASGYSGGGYLVFAVNNAGNLEDAFQSSPDNIWIWQNLGGSNLTGTPVVVPNIVSSGDSVTGGFAAFAVGTNGALYFTNQTSPGGGWSTVTSEGGSTIVGTPSVGTFPLSGYSAGGFVVFAVNNANELQVGWQSTAGSTTWNWAVLGYDVTGSPVAVYNLLDSPYITGGFSVFVTGTNGDLYTIWQDSGGGSWSSLASLGGATVSSLLNVVPFSQSGYTGAGYVVFAVNSSGQIEDDSQGSPDGTWAWQNLGGSVEPW